MDKIKLYARNYMLILNLQLRSRMSFRLNFFIMIIGVFLKEFATLALMIVLVQKFGGLAGWSTWEIAFLYSVVTLTFRNYASFTGGINQIGDLIRTGEMDSYMLTPLDPLFLINSRNTMVWRSFYNIGILILTIYCGLRAGIFTSVRSIAMFLLMMLCAMMALFAINLIIYTFAFYVIEVKAAVDIVSEEILKKYMIYPINIYGVAVSFIFTFIIPLGFASYYPSAYLLGKAGDIMFSPYLGILTPVIAVIWLSAALLFWKVSMRKYESTGS